MIKIKPVSRNWEAVQSWITTFRSFFPSLVRNQTILSARSYFLRDYHNCNINFHRGGRS